LKGIGKINSVPLLFSKNLNAKILIKIMKSITENDFPEIFHDIRELIERKSTGPLLNILIDIHPVDIAYILNLLKKEERKYLFNLLPTEMASSVLIELDPPVIKQLFEGTSTKEISHLVDQMDSDDAADIISELPDELANRVLNQVTEEVSEEVKELLVYKEDTAGGIMALEYVAVNGKNSVNETIEHIRKAKEEIDIIHTIWVIDDHSVLLGKVHLANLLIAKGNSPISEIMNDDIQYVDTDRDQEEVANIFRKYDLVTLPVVNQSKQLVGQITIDDIIDVVDEEASEDLTIFAGAHDEKAREESFLKISWGRLPWLIVAFVGQLISAIVLASYQATLSQMFALIFFVPIIMAMGGNSGVQSSVIVIRGLATGDILLGTTRQRFLRELRVALFIGIIFAILITIIIGIWLESYALGIVIGLALNIVILQATLIGGFIPFILKRFNIDPALASGPFITTFNDILGLLIYLTIVTLALNFYFI
jgi:magnesium transporter